MNGLSVNNLNQSFVSEKFNLRLNLAFLILWIQSKFSSRYVLSFSASRMHRSAISRDFVFLSEIIKFLRNG